MDGIYNFRDFGGYRTNNGSFVRKGRLYRSGSLAKASYADLDRIRALGIKTIIDLRTPKEVSDHPDRLPAEDANYYHFPIKAKRHNESSFILQMLSLLFGPARKLDYHEVAKAMYREYAQDFRPVFSKVLKLIAEQENTPVLVHCTAGKDRTGFVCSLILRGLGVPWDLVREDYLRTNQYLDGFFDQKLPKFEFFAKIGIDKERFRPLFEARQDFLDAAYHRIFMEYETEEMYLQEGLDFTESDKLKLNHLITKERN